MVLMFFGTLLRVGGFALNAALVFLLMPREPKFNWPDPAQISAWEDARETVFKGLRRVHADLVRSRVEVHRADVPPEFGILPKQLLAPFSIPGITPSNNAAVLDHGHGTISGLATPALSAPS